MREKGSVSNERLEHVHETSTMTWQADKSLTFMLSTREGSLLWYFLGKICGYAVTVFMNYMSVFSVQTLLNTVMHINILRQCSTQIHVHCGWLTHLILVEVNSNNGNY